MSSQEGDVYPAQPETMAPDASSADTPTQTPNRVPKPTVTDATKWKQMIAAAVKRREDQLREWQINTNYRVMQPYSRQSLETNGLQDRVALPEDWTRTKQKTSQLSYQLPKIVATAQRPEFQASAPVVSAALKQVLNKQCRAAYAVDEMLADVINASGLMVMKVGVDMVTEDIQVQVPMPQNPLATPPVPGAVLGLAGPPAFQTITKTHKISQRFYWERISTALFLWPAEFAASDWDKAPWLGFESFLQLEDAKKKYPRIPATFEGTTARPRLLSEDIAQAGLKHQDPGGMVKITEIWARASLYKAEVKHPQTLQTLVFVEGLDEPVVDELTDWQTWVEETPETQQPGPDGQPVVVPGVPGHFVGLQTFPIRVGTLVYVSDCATPPSDTMIGRSSVRELMRSRSQILRQRDRSIPLRWFDTNRLDEQVVEAMKNGEWQDLIPVNGPGERVLGEVARANYPRENFQFQTIINRDLDRAWSLSDNSLGLANAGQRSATEIDAISSANATRLDYEKGRVNRFIAEAGAVTFSLMQRFMDQTEYVTMVGPKGAEVLAAVNKDTLAGDYQFDFQVDSSDRIDLGTRQANIMKVWNLVGNAPDVNRPALLSEVFTLHGMDPDKYLVEAPEKGPDPANVSFRFSGEDLTNPIALSFALKSGYDIGPKDIQASAQMIRDALTAMPAHSPNAVPALGPPAPPAGPPSAGDITPPSDDVAPPMLKRGETGTRLV